MSLMGIDIGTNSCKAVVFSLDGKPLATASHSYKTYSPKPNYVEINANLFWDAVVKSVREAAQKASNEPISALSFCSQGETMIAVDKYGNPIRPAFMNADNRGTQEIRNLISQISREDLYQITGEPVHTMFGVSEVMWFKTNEPDLYTQTYKMVSCEDFIMMKLGFPPVCNYSNCCRTFMFDIRRHDWSDDILNAAGICRKKLGLPVPSGQFIGYLNKTSAELLGLSQNTAVVSGGHDCPLAAFGSGAISTDVAADQAGTYEGITMAVSTPNTSKEALSVNINTYCHVLKDKYISLVLFPAGFATAWYLSELAQADYLAAEKESISVYSYLERKIKDLGISPTGIFFMPHFVGACNPYNDIRSTGTVIGLTSYASRHKIYKSIYEGIAYEFKAVTSLLEKYVGTFKNVYINGGCSKHDFSLELRASLSGKTMHRMQCDEAGCLGAAMLAGISTGIYSSEEDAVKQAVHTIEEIEPNPILEEQYKTCYEVYKNIYPSLEKVRKLQEKLS